MLGANSGFVLLFAAKFPCIHKARWDQPCCGLVCVNRSRRACGLLWSACINQCPCCNQLEGCERNRCLVCQPCGLNRGFVMEAPSMSHLRQRIRLPLISREWRFEEGRLSCVWGERIWGWGAEHQLLNTHAYTHTHMYIAMKRRWHLFLQIAINFSSYILTCYQGGCESLQKY